MIRRRTVTLVGVGADGSAAANQTLTLSRPGFVRAVKVDNGAGEAVTADVTIRADSSTGAVLFTKADSATDVALKPVGMPGIDEGNAALAATDSSSGGWPFFTGLYFAIAQGDSAEVTVIDVLIET